VWTSERPRLPTSDGVGDAGPLGYAGCLRDMLILLRQGFGATRSETFSTSDKIRTLDETAPTNDLIHRVSDPGYNVIGHLFFPEISDGRILSVNADGSDRKVIVTGGGIPDGIVSDVTCLETDVVGRSDKLRERILWPQKINLRSQSTE
jgi:hypothetical protein